MDARPLKPEMTGSSPAGATVAIGQLQLSERSSLCRYVVLHTGVRLPLVTLWMGMPSGEGSGL